jgi:hypothetical protein
VLRLLATLLRVPLLSPDPELLLLLTPFLLLQRLPILANGLVRSKVGSLSTGAQGRRFLCPRQKRALPSGALLFLRFLEAGPDCRKSALRIPSLQSLSSICECCLCDPS